MKRSGVQGTVLGIDAGASRLLLLGALCLPLACKDGGCGGTKSGAASDAASTVATPTPSASVHQLRSLPIRASGVAGALFQPTSNLDLNEAQKTALDKIGQDLREGEKASRIVDGGDGRHDMKVAHAEIVAGVRAGKVDVAKIATHFATIERTSKAKEGREADALNRLHALLDAGQRKALVAQVRTNEQKRLFRTRAITKTDAGTPNFARTRLERHVVDLDLKPEQQKKVQALLPKEDKKAAETSMQLDTVLTAFESDGFDAHKLDLGDRTELHTWMAEEVRFFADLVPILDPEQRERLAARIGKSVDRPRVRHRGGGHDRDEGDDDATP